MSRNKLFVSYSHKDRKWLDELNLNLQPYLKDQGPDALVCWDDSQIQPGAHWRDEIESALASAKVAVLLVTANYLASRFIATTELPTVFRRESQDGLRIIWIPVSASAYTKTDLKDYQAASDPMRPLDTLSKAQRGQAWVDIAEVVAKGMTGGNGQTQSGPQSPEPLPDDTPEEGNVVLLYKRNVEPDETLLKYLEHELKGAQLPVFIDRHLTLGWRWADGISRRIEKSIAVVLLLSADSMRSDMLADELRMARKTAQLNGGRPRIIPVRMAFDGPLPPPFDVLNSIQHGIWNTPADDTRVLGEIKIAIQKPYEPLPPYVPSAGGALSPSDPYYVERTEDGLVKTAFGQKALIILIRGARQMGKTSMIARFMANVPGHADRTVFMDFQKMNESQLKDIDSFYMSIMQWLSDELGLEDDVEKAWSPRRAANSNLENYVQRISQKINGRLIWAMDEVDRLLSYSFATEFFGLVRSWFNSNSVRGNWPRLTIVIAYATEPHLFIKNLDQSPFNVGTKLSLSDFSRADLRRLNEQYGSVLTPVQLESMYGLLSGQPYLSRRWFSEVAGGTPFVELESKVEREDGPFGDHLRRILVVLARNPELKNAVAGALLKNEEISESDLYRLRRAGIFVGEAVKDARPRCVLYERYLRRHLATP